MLNQSNRRKLLAALALTPLMATCALPRAKA